METNSADAKIPYPKLSCNVLKIFACAVMIIDHIGYGILHNYMISHSMDITPSTFSVMLKAYDISRGIGRLAFPIFCFFIVEGFVKTRNVKKYALRLGLFAAISEIPFDLGLYGKLWYDQHQNVILTFFIALLMLVVIRFFNSFPNGLSRWVVNLACICTVIAFSDAAYVIHADYSWKCMLLAAVLYQTRNLKPLNLVAGAAATSLQQYGPISFLLLYFYDPDVRPRFKYAFYLFYPLHLLIIYLIARAVI